MVHFTVDVFTENVRRLIQDLFFFQVLFIIVFVFEIESDLE